MKRVLIVGAGGVGREVLAYLKQHPDYGKNWLVAGFLDDDKQALEGFGYAEEVVGGVKDYTPS